MVRLVRCDLYLPLAVVGQCTGGAGGRGEGGGAGNYGPSFCDSIRLPGITCVFPFPRT